MKKKLARVIQWITLALIASLGVLSVMLFLQIQEFGEKNVIAELAPHEDEFLKLQNWRIINVVQPDEIVPHHKLIMKVDAETKWNYFSQLFATIEISQSGDRIDTFESTFTFDPNERRLIEFPFFLTTAGTQDIKIELLFRNETDNHVFEQRIRHIPNLQVLSTADSIQIKQNNNLLAGIIVSGIIGISTATALAFSVYYSRKEVNRLEETAEIETRPWLGATTMMSYDSDKKMLIFHYKNYGKVPARNVMEIYGAENNLITEETVKGIQRDVPHISLVFPDQDTDFTIASLPEDTVNRIENGSGPLYIWIRIDYTYENYKKGQYGVIFEYAFQTRLFNVKKEWAK